MKRRRPVINLVLMMSLLGALTSCKEEEFYEKEYIQTFQEEYEDSFVEDMFDPATVEIEDPTGSTDGSNGSDGSGTTDGSDGSGSTDGSNGTNGSNGGSGYEPAMDTFTQNDGNNKFDILWVVDNSGSMREEQQQLAYNFDVFINKFIEKNIDFKMSITTTDTRNNNAGKPVQDSLTKLTSEKLAENEQQFLNDFADMIQVGTSGWGKEKGIKASEVFSDRFAIHHFRKDAYFVVVYVSDEEDQSEKTPENHLKQIAKWKDNAGLVKAYSIVNISKPYNGNQYLVSGYERYEDMSELTGGYISDINDNFYNTLLDMGNDIAELAESFPLSKVPHDASTIKVLVNGVNQSDGWEYDEQARTIKFLPGYVPAANAIINIAYEVES